MKVIKLALISVVVLFVIITAISALLPSHVLVSRAVDLHASVNTVKPYLFDLNHWQQWMTDANGNHIAQQGDNKTGLTIGDTRISIIGSTDSTIVTSWNSGSEMTGTLRIIDHHRADSVLTVQWQMEQHVSWYPWQKFASITKDEIWGGSMEKSLDNLKQLVEPR